MEANKLSQKFITIDILRALAALGVFYYHSRLGLSIIKYTGMTWLRFIDAFGAGYAVPLFFLISGYCIHAANIQYLKTNNPLALKNYYVRRFLRIYPPYFVALIFALAVNYSTQINYHPKFYDVAVHVFSLQGFFANYFNSINVVLWTISIELAFYLLYPIFYFIKFKYNLNYALVSTFIVSALSITFFELQGDISLPQHFFVLNLWFAWCCGAYLADKKLMGYVNLKKPLNITSYVSIVVVYFGLSYIPNHLSILFDQVKILLCTVPMIFIISKENWFRQRQKSVLVKLMELIGLSSYSLYLLHEPLIYLKNFLAHKYLPAEYQAGGVLIGFFTIPVIAWLSYLYIEKPFHSLSKKSKQLPS